MIQRKLSMKRVNPEIELEETEITTDDLTVPVKPVRKISKTSKEEHPEECKTDAVDEENAGDLPEDTNTETSEVDKNDVDDVPSPKDSADQVSQSGTVSAIEDSPQGAGGALSKRLRMYKCERCNTQYMGLAMLRQHCRDVHGDQKYYKCHVCGKLFSHPSSRNIHLRLHSGEKPYKCTTCGKQFRVSSHLKDHVRVHTGERPYICDICHKGFKQSSDLKKHRRTHTLDKPYKCPICPSAFTRSHHCRGHINSVHKFFKCVACSALFTSEDDFERHKEFHPSVFPDQADGKQMRPDMSDSTQKGNTQKDSTQEDRDIHEKNLKLDVANQLLELHKVMQQRASPSYTTGSGSETASDSGDDVTPKQSPAANQDKPAKPEPTTAASPGLMYQEASNRLLPNASHMGQVLVAPPKMTSDGDGIRIPQNVQVRYCHSPQPNPQGMDYLRVPFQSTNHAENRAASPERTGFISVTLPERRKSAVDQPVNPFYSVVNVASQPMLHFAMNVDHQRQRKHYANFSENIPKAGNVEVPKTAESQNAVPCHRVSVIQYHSSSPKASDDGKCEESLIKVTSPEADFKARTLSLPEPASKILENVRCTDQTPNHQMPQSYSLTMNNVKYLVGIPHLERVPYVPHTADSPMMLQPWGKQISQPIRKHSWPVTVKEEKKTYAEFNTRGQTLQFSPAKSPVESDQRNVFSQANAEPSTSPYNAQTSQEVPTDMLKYLSLREQNKVKNEERDGRTPPREDDSETSEASESGDVPNGRKLSEGARQESPSSESLTDQRDLPESSVHHCQVCNKTFSRSSLLKQHSVIHMGNKRFKFRCEVCGKMFRTRSHLRDHTRIHTGERPFKCHICQKAFKQSSDLKKHINLHTGANQFKCEECNMEFRRADALRKHKLGHKVGNMPCGHCGKNFLHIGALRAHRAMHNVQPVKASRSFHRCNYCFKTFTKAESYKIHIEEHSRDQNGAVMIFDCKICSMKFFTEAEFQDHMNIHNGKRPYKCFVCDKEFCVAEHLQDHVRLHSDATPRVRCEEGSDRFQMPDQVIRHSAIHA